MRIIEVRDGFIKFETDEDVSLSSFLEIEDVMKKYIAQVVKVTNLESVKVGYAKILYLYDGALYDYDKTLPEAGATIKPFSFELLKQTFQINNPIKAGYFNDKEEVIELDSKGFNKKFLISIDSPASCDRLISNLKQEFSKFGNVVVIDMLGVTADRKYTASVDFKLPLNTSALEFMYEDCLNDATSDSKSLIKEIFTDLSEYSKTVPFLPFGTLKTIVDDMVNKSHIFKLLVLKNKLAKFDREGYFAVTTEESNNLNEILRQKESIVDLSKLDGVFQNRYLSTIFSAIEQLQEKPQVFLLASNLIDKKNLKTAVLNSEIVSTLVTHSRFKYINEIKTMFVNFIIEPSFNASEVFKTYKTFLDAMAKDTYLIIGECTNYIPLVSLNKEFIAEPIIEATDEEVANNVDYAELEEALNLPEADAIDKKSEELIEKISEDFESETSENINIFDLESEDGENVGVNEGFSTIVHPSLEFLAENNDTNEEEQVVNSDIVESDAVVENVEVLEDEGAESGDLIVEENQEQIESVEDNTNEEILLEQEEIIEVEIPEDISDLAQEVLDEAPLVEELEIEEDDLTVDNEEDAESSESVEYVESVELIKNDNLVLPEEETLIDEHQSVENYESMEEYVEESSIIEDDAFIAEDSHEEIITEVIPISEEDEFGEIVELSPDEITEDDILIDFAENEAEKEVLESDVETLDKEIAEDVDKVFTTMKDDTISDSDLDFIDELNDELQENSESEIVMESQFEELPVLEEDSLEDDFVEPLEEINEMSLEEENQEVLETKTNSTPMVPVYDAEIPQEDRVDSDSLEQGDSVVHAKYGNGVVEKMIKYGSKTLYSINFDNVGRRLLDPTLTEIKKV